MSKTRSISLLWSAEWTQNLLFFCLGSRRTKIVTTRWQWTGHLSWRVRPKQGGEADSRANLLIHSSRRDSRPLFYFWGISFATSKTVINLRRCEYKKFGCEIFAKKSLGTTVLHGSMKTFPSELDLAVQYKDISNTHYLAIGTFAVILMMILTTMSHILPFLHVLQLSGQHAAHTHTHFLPVYIFTIWIS